jgi:hypothetical protein
MAKGSGGTQSTTTETRPFEEQIPFLLKVFQEAQGRFQEGPQQFFPGATVAPVNPNIQAGISATAGAAQPVQDFANQAMQANQFAFSPQFLDPSQNPGFQGSIDAITRTLNQNLTENILPSLASGRIATGNFDIGNTRAGVAQGQAVGETQNAIGDAVARFTAQGFSDALDAFTRNLALAPQTAQLQTTPGVLLDVAGERQRQLEQEAINAERERFEFGQQAPDAALAQFASLVSGNFGGTSTTTGPGARTNPLLSGIGTGAALAGTLTQIGMSGAVAGPVGLGIGLLSAFL